MRLGNSSWPSISGPIAPRSSSSSSSRDDDRALRVADRDVLELPAAAAGLERPAAVLGARGEVLGGGRGAAHVDRAGQLAGDRRPDRPGDGRDRELVGVGPAVAAQVEDRLAGAVAGELGLGAVGVEDPQLGDELRVLAAREQQDAVGADPEVRVAEPLDPRRGQLPGQRAPPRGSGSRCRAPATSRISRRGSLSSAISLGDLARRSRPVRSISVEVGDFAHPGELAAGVVARALLHRLEVAGEELVEAERLAGGAAGAERRRRGGPPRRRRRRRSPRSGRRSARRAARGPCRGRRSSSGGGSPATRARSPPIRAGPSRSESSASAARR